MFQYQRGGYCVTGSDTVSGVYYTTKGNGIALFTRRTGGLGGKEGAEGDEGKWFGSFALALILFHKSTTTVPHACTPTSYKGEILEL